MSTERNELLELALENSAAEDALPVVEPIEHVVAQMCGLRNACESGIKVITNQAVHYGATC